MLSAPVRLRRGQSFMPDAPAYPVEQEHSLELPLGYAPAIARPRIGVLLHAFHVDLLPEFRAYLDQLPVAADLFITTDDAAKLPAIEFSFGAWSKGAVQLRVTPNRGRDVAPKLVGLAEAHDRAEIVLHLHTKSSTHDQRLAGWRGYLLDTLMGTPATVLGALEAFARAPRLGMLAPQHIDELRPWIRWGDNFAAAEALAGRMGFVVRRSAPLDFPSGSMFWARSAALRPLLDLGLGFDDFPAESGQTDGTLAHAIERLYFHVCERAGYDWLKITARGELHDQANVSAVSSPEELDRFIARHRLRLGLLGGQARAIGDQPMITSPPPRPRRVLNAVWRAPLGQDAPPSGQRVTAVLRASAAASAALARSVEQSLSLLPPGNQGSCLVAPRASRAEALRAGFADGAGLVLLLDAPGLLHPRAAAALLAMSSAHGGRALIELAGAPSRPRPAGSDDLGLPWVCGPAIAVPRAAYDAIGGGDDGLEGEAADRDLSRRAQAQAFSLLLCPTALFAND